VGPVSGVDGEKKIVGERHIFRLDPQNVSPPVRAFIFTEWLRIMPLDS
jgi:hypothetical protein